MSKEFDDLLEMAQAMRRELEKKQEQFVAQANELAGKIKLMESIGALVDDYEKVKEENVGLHQQLAEEKRERAELEMKMAETRKISDGVARNASEEALLKALRTYANRSKRKTADKRAFAKMTIFEIASMNNLTLPDDLATIVDTLDDDQSEPKVVNVQGNYSDVHDNGGVTLKD